jgi:hypothetical protein
MIAKYKERKDDLLKQAEDAVKALNNEAIGYWDRWSEDFLATDRREIAKLFDRAEAEVLYTEVMETPCDVTGIDAPVVTPAMTVAQLIEAKLQSDMLSSMEQFTQFRYQTRIFTVAAGLSLRKGSTVHVIPKWYDGYIESWTEAKARASEYAK